MQGQEMILVIIVSVINIVLGSGSLIRGWQMHSKERLDLISDWDNHTLPNPEAYTKDFAQVYIGVGGMLILMPLLFLLGLPLLIWGAIDSVIVWYWFHAIDSISEQARANSP